MSEAMMQDISSWCQSFPGAEDCTGDRMKKAIREWYDLYYNTEVRAEEDPCMAIAFTIVSKLQKACFAEYEAEYTREGRSADFYRRTLAGLNAKRTRAIQQAMIGGEVWLKPIPCRDAFHWAVVRRDNVAILARNSEGEVTDLVSVEKTNSGRYCFHLLERRRVEPDGCLTIGYKLFRSTSSAELGQSVPLSSLPKYEQLQPSFTFPEPLHGLGMVQLGMPGENVVDGSDARCSIYAPAVRLIHNIDHNEWLMNQEFDNGKIRVFASSDLFSKDYRTGRRTVRSGLFTTFDEDPNSLPITAFTPALREGSFLARRTEYLRTVENIIGIKRGMLSEVEAAQRTATEVTSSEGDYALTARSLQELWETAVVSCMELCAVLGRMYRLTDGTGFDREHLEISWGNGVLYDPDAEHTSHMEMAAAGILRPEYVLAWRYGLPCDTPEQLQAIRKKYMPELRQLMEG